MFKKKKVNELIDILVRVRIRIGDHSDMVWTSYDTPEELRTELSKHLELLEQGRLDSLFKIAVLFAPTGALQEHSMSNGWSKEYIEIAERFDELYSKLK